LPAFIFVRLARSRWIFENTWNTDLVVSIEIIRGAELPAASVCSDFAVANVGCLDFDSSRILRSDQLYSRICTRKM
jgi:hypothetical protein